MNILLEKIKENPERSLYFYEWPVPYERAFQEMKECADFLAENSAKGQGIIAILEHEPVFTLGKKGDPAHLLAPALAQKAGIPLASTDRGGDITYHGPGQIIAYPIINMGAKYIDIARWVFYLEEAMQRTALHFGLSSKRVPGRPGLFCGESRKIGQVGIRIHEGVSYHGLSFNAAPNLEHFSYIMPCGLAGVSTTSLEKELGKAPEVAEVKAVLGQMLQEEVDKFFKE